MITLKSRLRRICIKFEAPIDLVTFGDLPDPVRQRFNDNLLNIKIKEFIDCSDRRIFPRRNKSMGLSRRTTTKMGKIRMRFYYGPDFKKSAFYEMIHNPVKFPENSGTVIRMKRYKES